MTQKSLARVTLNTRAMTQLLKLCKSNSSSNTTLKIVNPGVFTLHQLQAATKPVKLLKNYFMLRENKTKLTKQSAERECVVRRDYINRPRHIQPISEHVLRATANGERRYMHHLTTHASTILIFFSVYINSDMVTWRNSHSDNSTKSWPRLLVNHPHPINQSHRQAHST